MLKSRIRQLEDLLKISERKSDILTNLLKEASAEYEQVLEQIRVSEENFRTIINSVSDCIVSTRTDGTISMINNAGINMFGYETQNIINRKIDALFLDPQVKRKDLENIKYDPAGNWRAELLAVTADNTVFPAQISLSGIKGSNGENVGSVGVIRDISEEREVRRMKEDLVGMITHDMVNPILSLERAIQLMLEGSLGTTSFAQMELLQLSLATTHQLFGMALNLLDIYRNESGKFQLNHSRIDLHQIIQESIRQLRLFAKDKNIAIVFEPSLLPLELHGDQIRLMRACVNLIDNAIRFSPEGGTIQISSSMVGQPNGQGTPPTIPSGISAKLSPGQPYILTSISDQGPGVPLKDQESIFDKFFTTKRKGETRRKGVGLGLAFCKLAIESHLGQIWVNSPLESDKTQLIHECQFCFLLPAINSDNFSWSTEK
jgi:PAS domain S-box-containing protein